MTSFLPLSRHLLTGVLAGVLLTASDASGETQPDQGREALGDRSRAQVRFQASRADAGQLQRELLETAHEAYQTTHQQFLVGRGNPNSLAAWSGRVALAEQTLAQNPGYSLRRLEQHDLALREVDELARIGLAASRLGLTASLAVQYARLETEALLARLRAGRKQPGRPEGRPAGAAPSEEDVLGRGELARLRFEVGRADPGRLAGQRLEMARAGFRAALQDWSAGRGTLRGLLDWARRCHEAAGDLGGGANRPETDLVDNWFRHYLIEARTRAGQAAGRCSALDHLESRYRRLEAEQLLVQARPWRKLQVTDPSLLELAEEGSLEALKKRAQAGFEAATVGPADLEREKLRVARAGCEAARKELHLPAGEEHLLVWDLRRKAAAEAVSGNRSDPVALLEQRWRNAHEAEQLARGLHDLGRLGLPEYLEARFNRLETELAILQARK